jgi:hypothetical protein
MHDTDMGISPQGFVKLDEKLARKCQLNSVRTERKRTTIWTIEDWVLVEGIYSTTRYRKNSLGRRPITGSSASRKRAVRSKRLQNIAAATESHVNGSTTWARSGVLEQGRPVGGQHLNATAMPHPISQGGGHIAVSQIPAIAAGSSLSGTELRHPLQAPEAMQAHPQPGVLTPYFPSEQAARNPVTTPESVTWTATPNPMVTGAPAGTAIFGQSPYTARPLEHAEYLLFSALHDAVTRKEPLMAPQSQAVQMPLGYTSVSRGIVPQYARGLGQTLLAGQGHVPHLTPSTAGVPERTASKRPSRDVASSFSYTGSGKP